jgi:hypothetical protein
MMFGEPPYALRRASLLAWRLFPHLAGRARLRLLNESGSSVLELARFELSVFPGLLSCFRLHTWMRAFLMHVYLRVHTCVLVCMRHLGKYAAKYKRCSLVCICACMFKVEKQRRKATQVQKRLCVRKVRQVEKIECLRICAHSSMKASELKGTSLLKGTRLISHACILLLM